MLKAVALFLGLLLCSPLTFADNAPRKPGLMELEDHKEFFRPGKYLSYDPDYDQYTRSTYSRVEFATEEGITFARWRSSSVSTMPAVRPGEEGMFLKLRARNLTDVGIWDDRTGAFHYDNTLEELYPDIEAFLSSDGELQINPEDITVGTVDEYFDDAVDQTDGECCLNDEQYQEMFLGPSTTRCAWLPEDHDWDVVCNYRYINSGERRREYFRREVEAIM